MYTPGGPAMSEDTWWRGFSQNVQSSTWRPVLREELIGGVSYPECGQSRWIGVDQMQKMKGRVPRLRHAPLTRNEADPARMRVFLPSLFSQSAVLARTTISSIMPKASASSGDMKLSRSEAASISSAVLPQCSPMMLSRLFFILRISPT